MKEEERRKSARQKTFFRGLVYFGGSPSAVDCIVRDLSETGARLKFSGTFPTTDHLDLHIAAKAQTRQGKVQWRSADELGVSFTISGRTSDNEELPERVARLEVEIETLKQLLKKLQKANSAVTDAA